MATNPTDNALLPKQDFVEPSTMDFGDTPDSVIDYIADLTLHIAKLESLVVKYTPTPPAQAEPTAIEYDEIIDLIVKSMNASDEIEGEGGGSYVDHARHIYANLEAIGLIRRAIPTKPNEPTDAERKALELWKQVVWSGNSLSISASLDTQFYEQLDDAICSALQSKGRG